MHKTFIVLLSAIGLASCFQPAVPISSGPNYGMDVFWNDEKPTRPYEVMDQLVLSETTPLTAPEQPRQGRLRVRGNHQNDKDVLTAKMVMEARRMGATALMNVRYEYFTATDRRGYAMQATAIRYTGSEAAR